MNKLYQEMVIADIRKAVTESNAANNHDTQVLKGRVGTYNVQLNETFDFLVTDGLCQALQFSYSWDEHESETSPHMDDDFDSAIPGFSGFGGI